MSIKNTILIKSSRNEYAADPLMNRATPLSEALTNNLKYHWYLPLRASASRDQTRAGKFQRRAE